MRLGSSFLSSMKINWEILNNGRARYRFNQSGARHETIIIVGDFHFYFLFF